jgi:L-cystine uptake protein TcyP (sodium:dicarboxylate symporter family)
MNIHPVWYLCLTIRTILVLILYFHQIETKILTYLLTALLLGIGIGFVRKSITGSNDETQLAKVFWHDARIFHGILYIIASGLMFINFPRLSALFVFIDIIFSVSYRLITDQ